MKFYNLKDSGARGWYIGDFPEAILQTNQFEVGFDHNEKGYTEPHYHTKCTEIMLITYGTVSVGGKLRSAGDIIVIEPGDINDIFGVTEYGLVVVKVPAGGDDKVIV